MSGGIDMKNKSGVSSVVGVVLLLLLVIVVSSILALTLSTATQNAIDSTPNVVFTLSENASLLYHNGGDVLYKDRLKFYSNGLDITKNISIDSTNTWTEWHTGQAIELPAGNYVSNLTIIALDTLGRDQLLFRGSGVPVTPSPTPTGTSTATSTVTPTPTPTPIPTPSPYYVVGSEPYANASEFVDSLNAWKEGTADLINNGNSLLLFREIVVGNQPILLTSEIMGSDNILYITDGWSPKQHANGKDNITISRAPGYTGALLVIETGTLSSNTVQIVLDGTNQVGSAPLLVIENGAKLSLNEVLTVVNGINEGGEGGGIYNAGTLSVSDQLVVANNKAKSGGGVYNSGTSFSITQCDIYDNVASEKGGGIYNAGSSTVTINNKKAKVHDNSATDGSGVYNAGTLSGGFPITDNTASGRGGGIYNTGTLTFSSGDQSVLDNYATYGGGVYNEGTMTTAGSISGNTASISGGGVYNTNTGTYTFSGGSKVSGNQAQYGGGIYNEGSIPSLGNEIADNTATLDDGGVYNTGTINPGSISISDNEATRNGGGAYNTHNILGNNWRNISKNDAPAPSPNGIGDQYYATLGTVNQFNSNPGLKTGPNYYYID